METLILHVDEDPQLPPGLAESLAREGYRIVCTADPEEAVRIVEERQPALVLMEIELAGCDGLDLMAGLRAPERGAVPVLVHTRAERGGGLHGEAIALGASDFLCKPARAAELLRAIRESARLPTKAPEPAADAGDAEAPGSLAETPMPELLAELRRRRASGVLTASRGSARVSVELRGGHPVCVTSGTHRAPRGEEIQGLSEEEIQLEIGLRAEAALLQTFVWEEGRYQFSPDLRLAPGALPFARDGASLLLLGVLDVAPVARVRDRLRKCASLYVSSADAPAPLDGADLTPAQERLLAELDGSDPLSMLLDSKALEERLLYGLWVAGRIELHATPTITLSELHVESPAPADDLVEADAFVDAAADAAPAPASEVSPDPATDAERALEAQRWFEEGKGLLQAKRYAKAVEAFGMASHLDPGRGEVLAHLGYALFLSKPGQKLVHREAMEHVANGIKRSPDQEMSYVYLGRMLKANGDIPAATKLFRRALRVKPGFHPALQELRLLEMRKGKQGKGLLARLLGR